MAHDKFNDPWEDFPETVTPIVGAALDAIEEGIYQAHVIGEAAQDTADAASSDAAAAAVDAAAAQATADAALAAASTGASLVLALPSSPSDGDECVLVDSLSAPTYQWHLKYIAGASTYKWYYVGGFPLFAEVTTSQSTTSSSYTDLATAGPSVTVPVAGDYMVEIGAWHHNNPNGGSARDSFMSYAIGASAASDNDAMFVTGQSSTVQYEGSRARLKTAIAASSSLACKYRTGGGTPTCTWANRWIRVVPLRVG